MTIAALALHCARADGQPGGLDSIPSSLFGPEKKAAAEVTGPSIAATDELVTEVRIVGNKTIPTSQVLNQLQTRSGRPFDPALVQRDVRKLATRGWFVDVRPSYEQAAEGRVVIFQVVERPVIRYVEYLGNSGLRDKKLAKETGLKIGGPVDPYAIEEARRRLVSLYRESGYNNAQVTILEGTKPTDKGVVFVINEGVTQKVWKVEFVGAEFVSGRRLKTQVESKPPLMMVFKGHLDLEQVDADVEKLVNYYRAFGYFQAKVGRQLEFNEKGNWVTIRFVVHEGPRYNVRNVSFIGNKIFASESLAMGTKLLGNSPFEQAAMNGDVEWLKVLYGSQGYVFADIQAEPIFLEEPGQLDLMYHIEEGKQWRVGNIFVHIDGDTPHTRIQTALNRITVRPGEIVDIREVKASERRLQASGLFMADAARGIMPKITYRIQELGDTELASDPDSPSFRGQSPDRFPAQLPATSLLSNPSGVPLLPPPGVNLPPLGEQKNASGATGFASAQRRANFVVASGVTQAQYHAALAEPVAHLATGTRTFRVPPPPGFVGGADQRDVHFYIESANDDAEPELSPAAIRHEVRRYPVETQVAPSGQSAISQHSVNQPWRKPAATTAQQSTVYQNLVVRTQSPYQPPSPASYPQSTGVQQAPAAYGGKVVHATGPETAPAGYGAAPYPVQQAAITEPQLPPSSGAVIGPSYAPSAAPAPAFAPPPLPPAQYGAPQGYGPPVQYGPPQYGPPQYGPAPGLAPDPSITPVAPLPTNPQLFPTGPIDPFEPQYDENPLVDLFVDLNEAQTGRLMLGVAVNSDAGLVGQILLDEQNFDWTRYPRSMDELLSGRAWRGNGERFRIEAAPGTEVHRYLVSFQDPYLWDTPVSFGLSGSYFDRRYRDWDEQRLGGRVSLGYQWTENDLSAGVSYRGENVKISDISNPGLEELDEVVGDNQLHGFKFTVANDTRDSAFLATQGHYLELSLEQVVGTFDYPRAIAEARQYFLIRERPDHSGRHVVSASTRLGFTGDNTPIYENFFAGGFSTLRGFDFRGASPVKQDVQVGGEFMWVNTIEYLFPFTADDMLHGVVFMDFGTVEENIKLNSDNFRAAPGFGLRVTVPAMGPAPIALDFAFPIAQAEDDDEQVFSFNIGLQR